MSKYCVNEDNSIQIEEMNPTFLFTWKGTRTAVEEPYHCHDIVELAFVLSGTGKYHIEGQVYEVNEGDLLLFKPGVHHQALYVPEAEVAATEFFVGFCDLQLPGREPGDVPLPGEDTFSTPVENCASESSGYAPPWRRRALCAGRDAIIC